MAKILIDIPSGEFCVHMDELDIECILYNNSYNKCRLFKETLTPRYEDEDQIYLLGYLKCKECKVRELQK